MWVIYYLVWLAAYIGFGVMKGNSEYEEKLKQQRQANSLQASVDELKKQLKKQNEKNDSK